MLFAIRLLYKISVTMRFIFKNYSSFVNLLLHLTLCGDGGYICKSCQSKIKKNKVPYNAVPNNLLVE